MFDQVENVLPLSDSTIVLHENVRHAIFMLAVVVHSSALYQVLDHFKGESSFTARHKQSCFIGSLLYGSVDVNKS